ncbi:MAG TPA: hypothetical protein VGR21_10545, partial [Cryptosporangiaceae bacterium]|nr:hypothetical protein [Cryptosporangiaceae bacterium]
MGRSGVFFVATPAEVDGLDLAASPLGQLPAARVVPIAAPGPTGALACLVQVLDPGGAGDHVPGGGATDPGRPAPAVTQVDDRAVAVV